jgi:hypothetical protein
MNRVVSISIEKLRVCGRKCVVVNESAYFLLRMMESARRQRENKFEESLHILKPLRLALISPFLDENGKDREKISQYISPSQDLLKQTERNQGIHV